jgi:hypothetical protein
MRIVTSLEMGGRSQLRAMPRRQKGLRRAKTRPFDRNQPTIIPPIAVAPVANRRRDVSLCPKRASGLVSVAACSGNSPLGDPLHDPPPAAAFCAFGGIDPPPGLGLLPDLGKAGTTTGGAQFLTCCQSFAHRHKQTPPILLCARTTTPRPNDWPCGQPVAPQPKVCMPAAGQLFLCRGPYGAICSPPDPGSEKATLDCQHIIEITIKMVGARGFEPPTPSLPD